MTPEELLQTMRAALAEEREAIRRLDSEAIARANETKEAVLRRLRDSPPSARASLHAALDELKVDLRANLVLLTHARAYLREAQDAVKHAKCTAITLAPPSRAVKAG